MWEYKKKEYHCCADEAIKDFEKEAEDGWELIFLGEGSRYAIFKRRKK